MRISRFSPVNEDMARISLLGIFFFNSSRFSLEFGKSIFEAIIISFLLASLGEKFSNSFLIVK